jgi:hypothetical protein
VNARLNELEKLWFHIWLHGRDSLWVPMIGTCRLPNALVQRSIALSEIALSEMAYAFPLVRYDEPGLRVEF